jgi:hypothetical protein
MMDENEIERMAEELFEPLINYTLDLSLDNAASLVEALEIRCSNYADDLRDDLRRGRR